MSLLIQSGLPSVQHSWLIVSGTEAPICAAMRHDQLLEVSNIEPSGKKVLWSERPFFNSGYNLTGAAACPKQQIGESYAYNRSRKGLLPHH